MEPTSNPDNNRSPRGLSRFWPGHREDEESSVEPEYIALPGETQMVALGSRRGAQAEPILPAAGANPFGPVQAGPIQVSPVSSGPALSGPALSGPALSGPVQVGGATSAFPRIQANGNGAPFASAARGPAGGSPSDGPKPGDPIGGATPMPAGPPSSPGGGSASSHGGSPAASGPGGGPANPGASRGEEGDPDHSGASDTREDAAQAVESSRANPWDRDTGAFGGFGLGGRNGRFLFGGRDVADEPRPGLNGLNGHGTPELNGRLGKPGGEASTVDGPAPEDAAEQAEASDENGRDDMNGRAGVPGFTAPGSDRRAEAPAEKPAGDATDAEPTAGDGRRQATGWASVPTSTHPVVNPTSGAPVSSAPVSPGFNPGGYGQPPAYVPALPDPTAGPVSGVPAPRGTAPAVPAKPDTPANGKHPATAAGPAVNKPISPAGTAPISPGPLGTSPNGPGSLGTSPISPGPLGTSPISPGPVGTSPNGTNGLGTNGLGPNGLGPNGLGTSSLGTNPLGTSSLGTSPIGSDPLGAGPKPADPADTTAVVRTADDDLRPWEDESAACPPSPRRSASLEDVEPVRRGRRAAPDDEQPAGEQALRPGDVAAGHIAFWDDDATRHFRAAWHEVKAEFVDDPVRALTRAHDLLTDAVNELTEALLAERDELDPLRGSATPDTESMRMAMRGYREFLDRILAL